MSLLPEDPQPDASEPRPGAGEPPSAGGEAEAAPAALAEAAEAGTAPEALPPEPPDSALSLPSTPAITPPPPAAGATPAPAAPAAPPEAEIVEVRDLDWYAVLRAVEEPPAGERALQILERIEERLASGTPLGLALDEYREVPEDRAIQVMAEAELGEVWFVGDVHGDLLALEAALQQIERSGGAEPRIVFLGDLFDDGRYGAEVVLRVFELLLDGPGQVTVLAGNHDEALRHQGDRFQSTVLPSDFTEWLNAQADDHPWAERLGRVIIGFFARAPRAIFFPDGLLVTHGGVPHTDLHPALEETGDWNDPRVLQDFVWTRAHPRARKRLPNRTTRGCEFGRADFEAFCELATRLGRPVERLLRGHDHVEERFALFPAYVRNPVLTINTLSHRLPRELFGGYERVPVIARWVDGALPEVHRLHIPPDLIRRIYPERGEDGRAGESA